MARADPGARLHAGHVPLFRTFAGAYPSLWDLEGEDGLELGRYVEELGPAGEVAHVSNAAGVLGEGLPYYQGELDLDPVVARIGELFPPPRRAPVSRPSRARDGAPPRTQTGVVDDGVVGSNTGA